MLSEGKLPIISHHAINNETCLIMSLQANAYLAQKEPWKLEDPQEVSTVLSLAIEALRRSAILLSPVMPTSTQQMLHGLGHTSTTTWTHVQEDYTIDGMRNILEAVAQNGPQKPVYPQLPAPKDSS
jgi:methionyl-tRNA synthetase